MGSERHARTTKMSLRVRVAILMLLITGIILLLRLLIWLPYGEPAAWSSEPSITIEHSTPTDVEEILGRPRVIKRDLLGYYITYSYYYDARAEELHSPEYVLVFRGQKLIAIEDYSDQRTATVADFVALYGIPDKVTWASPYTGARRLIVFLERGVLILASAPTDPSQAVVVAAHYLEPCSMLCVRLRYSHLFGTGPSRYGPAGTPDDLPEDLWGYTIES